MAAAGLALAAAVLLQAAPGAVPETAVCVPEAEWRRGVDQMAGWFATNAMVRSKGEPGRAWLICKATDIGTLASCRVAGEQPTDKGYGVTAMKMRTAIRITPTPRGQTRWVRVPFYWDTTGGRLEPEAC